MQLTDKDDPAPAASDPCPQVPEFLLNFEQVETLTMELAHRAAMPVSETTFDEDAPSLTLDELAEEVGISDLLAAAEKASAEQRRAIRDLPLSPRIKRREVVATLDKATEFGELLFATAGPQGFFQAPRKGFVADGGICLWKIYDTRFRPHRFVGVLDLIHAVSYFFNAALAGRERSAGWNYYRQWLRWIWSGEVSRLIAALTDRAHELGEPTDEDSATSPRRIVSETPTYIRNQQHLMRYPEHHRAGLPITSSHMESTVKEISYRLKGARSSEAAPEPMPCCNSEPTT